jgi:tetratricopeptide (TPR) repeat protein
MDADAASIIDPTMFKAWYRKGVAGFHVKKNYEAMKALQAALAIDPNHEEAKEMLEQVQFALGAR